jgi:hypothetical protein
MFPSLFGHPNSPLTQRCLGPVLQQLDGLRTTPRAPQDLLQPCPIRRRQRLYPLSVTLKMCRTQCLSDDPSCRTAVATAKERGGLPQAASPDTGAYCRARDHLSPSGLAALVERTGSALENVRQPGQLWRGRRVRVVDGTGITLPDTPLNQAASPHPGQQAPGCGFPGAETRRPHVAGDRRLGALHLWDPRGPRPPTLPPPVARPGARGCRVRRPHLWLLCHDGLVEPTGH